MDDSNRRDKWELVMWEHESGKSWAEKEYRKLPNKIQFFVQNRLVKVLLKRTFIELRAAGDLEEIRGISKLEVTVPKNEIRIFGVITLPTEGSSKTLPIFNALHILHKKVQKIKGKDIALALQRLDVFNNQQSL